MRDPATDYTHAFVLGALPGHTATILEVGCGNGALAVRLQADGYSVVALDSDADAVAEAASRGVDARLATWPDFSGERFDAVLFTRSLHHIDDLEAGVAAAFDRLQPGGRVVVEDFDFDFADEPTFAWFARLLRVIAEAGTVPTGSEFLTSLIEGKMAPLEAWHHAHHHRLHSAEAIERALTRAAGSVRAEGAAYFFRYLVQALPDAVGLAEALLAHELDLVSRGAIQPLGRRWIAEAKT